MYCYCSSVQLSSILNVPQAYGTTRRLVMPESWYTFSGRSALCQAHLFTCNHATFEHFLIFLKLHTLHNKRLYPDAIFLFLFIQVYNVGRPFWMLLLFEFFLAILEAPSCLLRLSRTLRLLDVFLRLPVCVKTSNIFRKRVTYFKKILR